MWYAYSTILTILKSPHGHFAKLFPLRGKRIFEVLKYYGKLKKTR